MRIVPGDARPMADKGCPTFGELHVGGMVNTTPDCWDCSWLCWCVKLAAAAAAAIDAASFCNRLTSNGDEDVIPLLASPELGCRLVWPCC